MNLLNFDEIRERLHINKHTLDDELEIQAAIQFMISDKLSHAREHRDTLENELESIESRVYVEQSNQLLNGKKPSVEYLKNAVRTNRERTKKWLDFNAASTEHDKWEGLYYAWRSRNDALQALAKLAVSNYFAVETTYEQNRESSSRHQQSRPARRRTTT